MAWKVLRHPNVRSLLYATMLQNRNIDRFVKGYSYLNRLKPVLSLLVQVDHAMLEDYQSCDIPSTGEWGSTKSKFLSEARFE